MTPFTTEFDGTFKFTNPTKKDRKYLWNNKEYLFPAESTVPLIIMGEPPENVQEIRKRFAYRMAEERFYEGETAPTGENYNQMKNMGGGLPPTFTSGILEPWIEECLKPLPIKPAVIADVPKQRQNFKATKALGQGEDPNFAFAEENKNPPVLGQMPDKI
jgi:hypothetical protein